MTMQELAPIILQADEKAIVIELKRLGYTDCEKHKEYKHILLVDLFHGDLQSTETCLDKNGKCTYEGSIITDVKGYENFEFVLVNINDDKHHFPVKLRFFAKEIGK